MAAANYQSVLTLVRTLSGEEQLRLVSALTASEGPPGASSEPVSILDLCGLGAEIWNQMDAQEYVSQERSTWAE